MVEGLEKKTCGGLSYIRAPIYPGLNEDIDFSPFLSLFFFIITDTDILFLYLIVFNGLTAGGATHWS